MALAEWLLLLNTYLVVIFTQELDPRIGELHNHKNSISRPADKHCNSTETTTTNCRLSRIEMADWIGREQLLHSMLLTSTKK